MEDLSINPVKRENMYDLLKDPCSDRTVKDLPLPPCRPIDDSVLYSNNDHVPNWRILQQFLRDEGELSKV